MSGGGLLNFGFVRADKTTSREDIVALKTARTVREAIDLEHMKVQVEDREEARLLTVVRGKIVSQNKEAIRKRRERCRGKKEAATSDEAANAAQAISSVWQ